jgi:hypothetical protein
MTLFLWERADEELFGQDSPGDGRIVRHRKSDRRQPGGPRGSAHPGREVEGQARRIGRPTSQAVRSPSGGHRDGPRRARRRRASRRRGGSPRADGRSVGQQRRFRQVGEFSRRERCNLCQDGGPQHPRRRRTLPRLPAGDGGEGRLRNSERRLDGVFRTRPVGGGLRRHQGVRALVLGGPLLRVPRSRRPGHGALPRKYRIQFRPCRERSRREGDESRRLAGNGRRCGPRRAPERRLHRHPRSFEPARCGVAFEERPPETRTTRPCSWRCLRR